MAIDPFERLQQRKTAGLYSPGESVLAYAQQEENHVQQDSLDRQKLLEAIVRAQERQVEEQAQPVQGEPLVSYDLQPEQQAGESASLQSSILPTKAPLTQAFGNRSSVEAYSKGVNLGADFGVKKGTPVGLPPGEWEVVTTFSGAKEGDRGANSGSGNIVRVRNTKTGEVLAFEHLSEVSVSPGSLIKGGTVIGKTGNTGNSTGPHLSIPYKNAQGQYQDVLQSPYARYLFGS
jgi:murein DD-endopeptidase MepM/ murein hydrolase activator NlpD